MDACITKLESIAEKSTDRLDGIDLQLHSINLPIHSIDNRLDGIDTRLDRIDERFDKIDERFDKIDERFDRMDEHFQKVDEHFLKVDARFEQVNVQLAKIVGAMEFFATKADLIGLEVKIVTSEKNIIKWLVTSIVLTQFIPTIPALLKAFSFIR